MNTIYLRRKNKLMIPRQMNLSEKTDLPVLASALKNLEGLGYTFSLDLLKACFVVGNTKFVEIYNQTVSSLRKLLGAHRKYEPMYPNFPSQVMEASDAELYLNALMHYVGDVIGVRILPVYETEIRPNLNEKTKVTTIELGSESDFIETMKNIMGSKTNISIQDTEDIQKFLAEYKDDLSNVLPDAIPNKEVLAMISSTLLDLKVDPRVLTPYFKTATDVLRLAVSMSKGDVSLAKPTRFRNFKRSERILLITLLNQSGNARIEQITEDMLRFKKYWIRLGEKLHVNEYRYASNAIACFDTLRNDKPFSTTNSKIEESLVLGDVVTCLSLLKARPGDFARRLDHLLRLDPNLCNLVLHDFKSVAKYVSTPVLLQVMNHFKNRSSENRFFMPKGSLAKVQTIKNNLPSIDKSIATEVSKIIQQALLLRFSDLDSLGKVYIDPVLKKYNVPFSQRSASKALKTLVRGSRIEMDNKNFLRFFIYWKQPSNERVDIDLSACFFDKDWSNRGVITYYNLRESFACHSGDITSAPNGASEFIDININRAREEGIRYIAMSICSYTSQKYCDLPECFAGFMTRKQQRHGTIHNAKTVKNKIDLASESQVVIPMIFDIEEMEMIWADISLKDNERAFNNVRNNSKGINLMCRAMTEVKKANLYDLFYLHALSRGQIVDKMEEADTVFLTDRDENSMSEKERKIVTAFDIDEIMSKFL